MAKFKPNLRSLVRDRGRAGFGVELFRLDAVDVSEDLTEAEAEVAEESKEEASSTAVMRIYEHIGEDDWTGEGVSVKKFAEELEAFGDIKRLNIHINSLGGCAFTAQAIHSILCDHPAKKTAYIDGVAASAATLIACGADEVVARHNINYMVHHPWAIAMGNAETMRKAADDLDACTVPIISVYKAQVGDKIDEKKIRELMDDETWMTAEQALEWGFVDTIRGKIKAIARVGQNQIMCSGRVMDVSRYDYHNVPKFPAMKPQAKLPSPSPTPKEKTNIMKKEDIDPQLLASIETAARDTERQRLADLDALAGPGLDAVITKAKAEGSLPGDIALECLKITKAQLADTAKAGALVRDAQAAGTVRAGDAPHVKPPEPPDPKKRGLNLLVNAVKARNPQAAMARNGN